jgi:hypothetical protein
LTRLPAARSEGPGRAEGARVIAGGIAEIRNSSGKLTVFNVLMELPGLRSARPG